MTSHSLSRSIYYFIYFFHPHITAHTCNNTYVKTNVSVHMLSRVRCVRRSASTEKWYSIQLYGGPNIDWLFYYWYMCIHYVCVFLFWNNTVRYVLERDEFRFISYKTSTTTTWFVIINAFSFFSAIHAFYK